MRSFLLADTSYTPKEELKDCLIKTRIIVGQKENKKMKKSAKLLNEYLTNSKLLIKERLYHGEYSLNHPKDYVKELLDMFN